MEIKDCRSEGNPIPSTDKQQEQCLGNTAHAHTLVGTYARIHPLREITLLFVEALSLWSSQEANSDIFLCDSCMGKLSLSGGACVLTFCQNVGQCPLLLSSPSPFLSSPLISCLLLISPPLLSSSPLLSSHPLFFSLLLCSPLSLSSLLLSYPILDCLVVYSIE